MREVTLFRCSKLDPEEIQQLKGQDLRSKVEYMGFLYSLADRVDGIYGDRFSAIKPFMDRIPAKEVRYDFYAFRNDVRKRGNIKVEMSFFDSYDIWFVNNERYILSKEEKERYGYTKEGDFYVYRRWDMGNALNDKASAYFKAIYGDDSEWNQKLYTPIPVKSLDVSKITEKIAGVQQENKNSVIGYNSGVKLYNNLLRYKDEKNVFIMFSGYKEDWEL